MTAHEVTKDKMKLAEFPEEFKYDKVMTITRKPVAPERLEELRGYIYQTVMVAVRDRKISCEFPASDFSEDEKRALVGMMHERFAGHVTALIEYYLPEDKTEWVVINPGFFRTSRLYRVQLRCYEPGVGSEEPL